MNGESSVKTATICISTGGVLSPGKVTGVLYRPFTPSMCEVKKEWICTSFLPLCLHDIQSYRIFRRRYT